MTERPVYWIAMTRPVVPWSQIAARIHEHTDYLDALAGSGQALASGPFLDNGEPRGEGLTLLRAADEAEARALAEGDPLVQAGLWTIDIRMWQVHQIAPTVTL